jgi:ribokinase
MKLITVGDVMVDVVCSRAPRPGQRVHGTATLRAGGSAVNAAFAAVGLDAKADVVGRIGIDAAGDLVMRSLERAGVTAALARDPDVSTGIAVSLDEGGTPSVVADRGANAHFAPDDLPPQLRADALLVSGFALFQEGSRAASLAALARFDGTWTAVDLASPKLAALDFEANVVFATAAEAKAVTDAEPEAAARELASKFGIACVKLGVNGAVAVEGNRVERASVNPVVRCSPFGAGDEFAAAFLVGLAHGDDLAAAVARACAAGARAAGRALVRQPLQV